MHRLILFALLVLGVGFAAMAMQSFYQYRQISEAHVRAHATVRGVETRDIRTNRDSIKRFFHPIFHFELEDGESHFVVLEQGTQLRHKYYKDDEATLVFPRGKPKQARLATLRDSMYFPFLFAGAALICLVLVFYGWRKNKGQPEAGKEGRAT